MATREDRVSALERAAKRNTGVVERAVAKIVADSERRLNLRIADCEKRIVDPKSASPSASSPRSDEWSMSSTTASTR